MVLFLSVVNVVEAQKNSTSPKDANDVRRAFNKLVAAFDARDAKTIVSFFAEDAIVISPLQPDADYKTVSEGFLKEYSVQPKETTTVKANIEEIQVSGNLAFVRMMWFVERQSDKQIISRLKDLEIWQRQSDGSWKLARGLSFHLKPENK